VEAGDKERPRQSDLSSQAGPETHPESTKRRDANRLIRAARKIAHELRQISAPGKPKKEKEEKIVFRAFITVDDEVVVEHLQF
jgi:hypothetical protein